MEWIKGKVRGSGHGGDQDKQSNSFIVGSDKWMGSSSRALAAPMAPIGSFKNPESAWDGGRPDDASPQPNPYVQISEAPSPREYHASGGGVGSGMYPDVYGNGQQQGQQGPTSPDSEERDVLTGAQVLLTIPGAVVHLIDDEESVHLATGDFSLVRFVSERTKVVVIAKVGEELKWPLVEQEPTVKLDPTHYFFSLKVPKSFGDDDSDDFRSPSESRQTGAPELQTLNYGLTLPAGPADEQQARIQDLDYFLNRYSLFSAPTIVQGDAATAEEGVSQSIHVGQVVSAETLSGEGTVMADEEASAAFWTTVAPNVDDYNHRLAKWIATGTGQVIKQIFVFSDSTVNRLNSRHDYMKSKYKPKAEPSKISPVTVGAVRSVRKLSTMTDNVAGGVLGGILYTTGLLASAIVNSPPGRVFFRTTPGEVVLVSLDAFGTMFDAIEKAGRDVLGQSSTVTQDFVNYRYGESARELTDESFRAAGHAGSTVWSLTKIQKAFNPKTIVSKTGMAKKLGKQAVKERKPPTEQTSMAGKSNDPDLNPSTNA